MDTYTLPNPLLQRHACSTINRSLQPSHVRGVLCRGILGRHCKSYMNSSLGKSVLSWDLVRTVSHPPLFRAWYSLRLAFLTTVAFRSLRPPPPYTTSSPAPSPVPPSPDWRVTWDPVPLRWALRQWGPHNSAVTSKSFRVWSGWGLGSQCLSASHPRILYCGGSQWPPLSCPLRVPGESHPKMTPPGGAKRVPILGVTLWKNWHSCWSDIVKPAKVVWGNTLVNPESCFTPDTQVSTFSSTHICLASSESTNPPRFCTPSP